MPVSAFAALSFFVPAIRTCPPRKPTACAVRTPRAARVNNGNQRAQSLVDRARIGKVRKYIGIYRHEPTLLAGRISSAPGIVAVSGWTKAAPILPAAVPIVFACLTVCTPRVRACAPRIAPRRALKR
jgi:hypothetical protein